MNIESIARCLNLLEEAEPGTPLLAVAANGLYINMESRHHEVLKQLMDGPVFDGDIVSKTARDDLLDWDLAVRVVNKKELGYVAATQLGWDVYENRPK